MREYIAPESCPTRRFVGGTSRYLCECKTHCKEPENGLCLWCSKENGQENPERMMAASFGYCSQECYQASRQRENSEGKIVSLRCCCCDEMTKGRQWWNRDKGYGLCVDCANNIEMKETPENMANYYGVRGVHYDVEA